MKKKVTHILLGLTFALLWSGAATAATSSTTGSKTSKAALLKGNLRQLWVEHVIWTRNVVFCIVDELPGKEQAVNRLLQNQVDIGQVLVPYYGQEIGSRLASLLQTHVNIGAEVMQAAKTGRNLEESNTTHRWEENADAIATFLCNNNRHWNLAEMKDMMQLHLQLTFDEVKFRIAKDYIGDVVAFDRIQVEILKMSDMIAVGILRQFPKQFKAGAN